MRYAVKILVLQRRRSSETSMIASSPRAFSAVVAAMFLLCVGGLTPASAQTIAFSDYVESLWPAARANGITRATFDAAATGLQPDAEVIALTKRQPEYGKPLGAYIADAVTPSRVAQGAKLADTWKAPLAGVRTSFGVNPSIVVAIWGIETHFGTVPSRKDVFRSLATLAHVRYRDDFFRDEFLAALTIVQNEKISRARMTGSWAGAMGQAQFIPSSYLKYAVDFSNDGQKDIWTNVPDVMGSIANYLAKAGGWQRDLPWGFEVLIPPGFDYRRSRGSFRDWKSLGVKRGDGGALPEAGDAVMLFPASASGPAFLVTANFLAIRAYNNSDAYALAVAHLADRVSGGKPFVTRWPADVLQLSREDRIKLQKRMAQVGFKVSNFVGQIDFDLRDAIREVQTQAGWRADGHPTEQLLAYVLALPVRKP